MARFVSSLTPEQIGEIKAAPPGASPGPLAERFGVSASTIKRLRRQGRQETAEAAREVVAERVQRELPNALEALGAALRVAVAEMEATREAAYIRETRECAKAMLEYAGVTKDDDPVDGVTDAALIEELMSRGILRPD